MDWMLLEKALKPFAFSSFSLPKGKLFVFVFTRQAIIFSALKQNSFCIQKEKMHILLQHCFIWRM